MGRSAIGRSVIPGRIEDANPESPSNMISRFRVWSFGPSRNDGESLSFKQFVGDDLNAEAGQSLVVERRRRQMADRGDAEIAQDLRAYADLPPLLVAIGFRRSLSRQR